MAITFTSVQNRPNTSVTFYTEDTGLPAVTNIMGKVREFAIKNGLPGTRTISEDQLTRTSTITYNDISQFEEHYNIIVDLEMAKEYTEYATAHKISNKRTLTGLDSPFCITTTYQWAEGVIPESELTRYADIVARMSTSLVNTSVNNTSIVIAHNYANSDAFSNDHFNDYMIAKELLAYPITKTSKITLL